MANIGELLARAAALRDETALNSISPNRAGGIMYDTLLAMNELWLQQGAALVISKIYASVAAMEADTAPVSDLTGLPLRPGQIVVIASSDSDNGSVYRYNGTSSPSWSLVGEIGNLEPVDNLNSDSTSLPLAAHQGKVLDGKISQLQQELPQIITQEVTSSSAIWGFSHKLDGKKVFAKIYCDSGVQVVSSAIYNGATPLNLNILSYFQYFDLSAYSSTQLYLQLSGAGNAYIEYILADSPLADEYVSNSFRTCKIEADSFNSAPFHSYYLHNGKLDDIRYKVSGVTAYPVLPTPDERYGGGVNKSTVFDYNGNLYVFTTKLVPIESLCSRSDNKITNYTKVIVKKDGSGDYATIQDAINSITDASEYNQYIVEVWDDFFINDLTDLWLVSTPNTKNASPSPNSPVALVITKDWVTVRGCGGKRTLSVESPNISMAGSCFANIQTIYPKGNCTIENFNVLIKGGRYAIHQESGGSKTDPDYHATTIYKDLYVRHYGNSAYTNGSSWSASIAQANGTTSGLVLIFENCEWVSDENPTAFYTHSNTVFDEPNKLIFKNCTSRSLSVGRGTSETQLFFADRYSCQNNKIEVYGCDFPQCFGRTMEFGVIQDGSGSAPQKAGTNEYCFNPIIGYGNKPCRVHYEIVRTLYLESVNTGIKLEVIGGSAKDDIFGNTIREWSGIGIKGAVNGSVPILDGNYSRVASLPYLLGNCASSNKTLIVRVTNLANNTYQDVTITFDKNYMTADGSAYSYNTAPNISQDAVFAEINTAAGGLFTAIGTSIWYDSFIDCQEKGYNSGDTAISVPGRCVVRDIEKGMNCWRLAVDGEIAEGVAANPAAKDGQLKVFLVKKNTFQNYVMRIWSNLTVGTLYKVNNDGGLTLTENTSEASFVAVGETTLAPFNP